MTDSPALTAAVFYYQHRIHEALEVQSPTEEGCYLAGPEPMPVGTILALRLLDEGRAAGPYLPARVDHVDERPRRAKEGASGMRVRFLELEEETAAFWKAVLEGTPPRKAAGEEAPEEPEPPAGAERPIPEPEAPAAQEAAPEEDAGTEEAPPATAAEVPGDGSPAAEQAEPPEAEAAEASEAPEAPEPEEPSTEIEIHAEAAGEQDVAPAMVSGEIQAVQPGEPEPKQPEPSVVAEPQEPQAEASHEAGDDQAPGNEEEPPSQPKKKRRRGRRKKKRR